MSHFNFNQLIEASVFYNQYYGFNTLFTGPVTRYLCQKIWLHGALIRALHLILYKNNRIVDGYDLDLSMSNFCIS